MAGEIGHVRMLCVLVLCLAVASHVRGSAAKPPNIVMLLTDDLGFNAPGYRNPDLITPTLDALASDGVKLDQLYTYKFCSPSRGSFLTGRFPYHFQAVQNNLIPPALPLGIDLEYIMLPKMLASAGYTSHHIGKWHQGFFQPAYTPLYRGFNTSYGFLEGGQDHYTQRTFDQHCTSSDVDLSENGQPAYGKNGTYNSYAFTERAVNIIESHAASTTPFFIYFAIHNTHAPVEAPPRFVNMYNFSQPLRNTFNAMVSVVDETAKNVTLALKRAGLWDNTLVVWMTDNGSPVTVAGSNEPLRGGKGSNWEGGVRVPGFVTGGVVPQAMRGKTLDGLIHIADWYSTFCSLANISPDGPGPAPVESLNMWPYLSGTVPQSPRQLIVHDHNMFTNETTGAIRWNDWKLIVGGKSGEAQATWYGHFSPNSSHIPSMDVYDCVGSPCLFDIKNDPTEHVNQASSQPSVLQQLLSIFHSLDPSYHPPRVDPPVDQAGYCKALRAHKDFVVPWRT